MKPANQTVLSFRSLLFALLICSFLTGCVSRRNPNYSFGNRWAGRVERARDAHPNDKKPEPPPNQIPAPPPYVPPAPVYTPPPAYVPPPVSGNSTEIRTENVWVIKSIDARGSMGSHLNSQIKLTPLRHIGEVDLNVYVPDNATFVKAEPPPTTVAGKKLTWSWFELKKDEVQNIIVYLQPTGEGNVRSCVTVHALPMGCVNAKIGSPRLAIQKTGPASANLGQAVTYNINVSNTGNSMAENVILVDNIPVGMRHASGQQQVSMTLGNLAPGQSRDTQITLTPQQRGEFTNRAEARSSNAGTVSDTAVTRVLQSGVKIDKTGPPEQFLGKSATYQITVRNTGDTKLSGVTVTDNAPTATRINSASGAQVQGNQATWAVGTLDPGQSRTMSIDIAARQPGTTVNHASVSTAGGLTDSAQAQTLWRGFAAVLVEMVDSPDPLLIGDSTTYTLRVTNQGTAPDSNVQVRVQFPDNIQPVSANGETQGQVQGSQVVFGALTTIAPKQVATWTIQAKAISQGDGRVNAFVDSAVLKGRPVTEVESTQVY